MTSDYDFIDLQYENYGTLKKLKIEKRDHDHDVRAFEVVSSKNNGLQLRTVYYTKNNKKGSQADRTATSKSSHVAGTTSPINNIAKDSEKSNTEQKKTYSLRERDDEYMKAVRSGNMREAQRMVDEAAKKAGWRTVHAFVILYGIFSP